MGAFLVFLLGLFVGVVAWLRKTAGETQKLDAADAEAAKVAAAKSHQTRVEEVALLARAEADRQKAAIDAQVAEEKAQDSVAVANRILGEE